MSAETPLTRRRLLQSGLLAATAVSFGPQFWRDAMAATGDRLAQAGPGPYGPLLPPDANGIQLPQGFSSRLIARSGRAVEGTSYSFPIFPDGQATYATPDGGWILVTNSEVPLVGGVSAIRFDRSGAIVDAYRILGGTSTNCAGGPTPWGTWLSCEEVEGGRVWECDPTGARRAVVHDAMGVFKHEAACVDPAEQVVYLTEDIGGGGLYRFTPTDYPDLAEGLLEIACGDPAAEGHVIWREVPNPGGGSSEPTREQVDGSLKFARGEGIWFDDGIVYVATTSDETIHAYDTRTRTIGTLYRADDAPGTPLRGVDNLHVSRSGDLYVAEDSYDNDPDAMDVCIISPEGDVSRFLKLTGDQHFQLGELGTSETVGLTFDPSGTRLYLGSQRAWLQGAVYEISGPFRQQRPQGARPITPGTTPADPAPAGGGAAETPAGSGRGGRRGAPLGLDVARQIGAERLIGKGLALALTLDQPATVTLKLTARIGTGRRQRKVVLASRSAQLRRGAAQLRLKPSRSGARTLRARRRAIAATLEVRVRTAGAPPHLLRRTVRIQAPAAAPRSPARRRR
ncbi:DUF839 domain-containing protein [Conexibacter sp. JD483]|uniref:alkaline phosphatase PhoX n=1 Tax=unclassified Conexibacter TaxID=2627773 RepID=UPI002715ED45|nr:MULTISPECIES: alkaline phosphatase PhoX [unclassified Conexibacter]MDO8189283.1 DUF839 domain-containing protein [Conexibacter sp. CPCC 205706]MDO8201961.1 DUF839 domain-containing protein [Conexibacter sp. CPCC 205762]MDR9372574.1 DUF839 domain-containing protein [Conexibacter sp. JD483]